MKHPNLVRLLTALLPAGTVALSTALAPPAQAAVEPSVARKDADVAARLAKVQAAVSDAAIGAQTDPRIQKVWWANGGWGRPGWGNGGGWGWRNGGWRNGGWGNWHPWHNGWGNWHPWGNGGWLNW